MFAVLRARFAHAAVISTADPLVHTLPARFYIEQQAYVEVGAPHRWTRFALDAALTVTRLSEVEHLGRTQPPAPGMEWFYLERHVLAVRPELLNVTYVPGSGAGSTLALGPKSDLIARSDGGRATFALHRDTRGEIVIYVPLDRSLLALPEAFAPVLAFTVALAGDGLPMIGGANVTGCSGLVDLYVNAVGSTIWIPEVTYDDIFTGLNVHTSPASAFPDITFIVPPAAPGPCEVSYAAMGIAGASGCSGEFVLTLTPADYIIRSDGGGSDSLVHLAVQPWNRTDAVELGAPAAQLAVLLDVAEGLLVLQRVYPPVRYTAANTVFLVLMAIVLSMWISVDDISWAKRNQPRPRHVAMYIASAEVGSYLLTASSFAVNVVIYALGRRLSFHTRAVANSADIPIIGYAAALGAGAAVHALAVVAERRAGERMPRLELMRSFLLETLLMTAMWFALLESPRDLVHVFSFVLGTVLMMRATVLATHSVRAWGRDVWWRAFVVLLLLPYYVTLLAFTYAYVYTPALAMDFFSSHPDGVAITTALWTCALVTSFFFVGGHRLDDLLRAAAGRVA